MGRANRSRRLREMDGWQVDAVPLPNGRQLLDADGWGVKLERWQGRALCSKVFWAGAQVCRSPLLQGLLRGTAALRPPQVCQVNLY